MRTQKLITRGDLLLIAAIILIAAGLWLLPLLTARQPATVQIETLRDGTVQTYALHRDADYHIESGGVCLTVCVRDGCVYVGETDCRDRICLQTGKISRAGQSIVCAPAGVAIRITGGEVDADVISG